MGLNKGTVGVVGKCEKGSKPRNRPWETYVSTKGRRLPWGKATHVARSEEPNSTQKRGSAESGGKKGTIKKKKGKAEISVH